MDEIRELDLKKVLHTLSCVNSARPQLETAPFKGPKPQDPAGNFYASEIKNIQDDSRSVFPESVYSDVIGRRKRWSSTYENHFIPRQEEQFDQWVKEYMSSVPGGGVGGQDKTGSAPPFMTSRAMAIKAKDQLQLGEKNKKFMSWKVPNRITEEDSSSRMMPDVSEKVQPTPAHLRKAAQSATPRMMLGAARGGCTTPRVNTCQTPAPQQCSFTASGQPCPYRTKTYRTQQLFRQNESAPQYGTLHDFLQTSSEHERRCVERTLRMIYNKEHNSQEAVRNVQRWVDAASDEDRKVALNFFSSIGMQMMGNATPRERQVIQKVLGLLKDHTGRNPYKLGRSKTEIGMAGKDTSLQYIRLLTPGTRASKWQHQTWHHLPVYNDKDAVLNKSAIYTEPGSVHFRHWNIHPDWQLKQQS